MKLKGHDWTELGEYWLICKPSLSDKTAAQRIKQHLLDVCGTNTALKQTAKDVRTFLRALIKQENSYSTPVWKGLLAVKDDETLLKFTIELLECMWT
jgi:hypothetical protein